jgi:hypothetical protein
MKLSFFKVPFALIFTFGVSSANAADYPRERNAVYNQNLDFVNQALEKRKQKLTRLTADVVATGGNPVELLSGRPYRLGEAWDVVSYYIIQNAMPGSTLRTDYAPHGKISSFHYRVTQLAPLQIEVTETAQPNSNKTDPEIASVTLTYDSDFREIGKAYHRVDGQTIEALVGGMHARGLPLEIYAIDAPNVTDAEAVPYRAPAELIASLSPPLAAIAQASQFGYDPVNAQWLKTTDGFGREVDVVWQKGNPWPSYVRTERGISILVSEVGHDQT